MMTKNIIKIFSKVLPLTQRQVCPSNAAYVPDRVENTTPAM